MDTIDCVAEAGRFLQHITLSRVYIHSTTACHCLKVQQFSPAKLCYTELNVAPAPNMRTSQFPQTDPCAPRHLTSSPPPPDPLYGVFEDTVATLEMLIFPVDHEISTTLLNNSSQDFLEDILDQLIEWGFDTSGRSGSLKVIAASLVGDVVRQILENMQDELDKIQMQAVQWQKTR